MIARPIDNSKITRITSIFRDNGWFNTQRSEAMITDALNHSFELASVLDDGQFNLFCVLLKKYCFIEQERYVPSFERALSKLAPSQDPNHIYRLLPLIAPKDKNKVKSGNSQLYGFAYTTWKRSAEFRAFHITPHLNSDEIKKIQAPKKPFTTIVVDDFIGTGNTALEFLADYSSQPNHFEEIVFISLVAMQEGIKSINNLGHRVITDKVAVRGIADCALLKGEEEFYKIMSQIEDQIKISDDYRRGYGASEALVTMQRTPNNTFPLFWAKSRADGSRWPSPFPR